MNKRVLIVDGDSDLLFAFKMKLRSDFEIHAERDPAKAMHLIENGKSFAVAVACYKLPGMSGFDFLSRVRAASPDTVRVILTDSSDVEAVREADNEGEIFTFLTKPCKFRKLHNALTATVEHYRLVKTEKELLDKTLKGSIKLLIDMLSVVNPKAFSLGSHLRDLAKNVAQRLGVKNIWEIEIATLLSQIGCVGVPSEIVEKIYSGEPLNQQEKKLYDSHPRIGKSLLKNIPRMERIADAIADQFKGYRNSDVRVAKSGECSSAFIASLLKLIYDYERSLSSGMSKPEIFQYMRERPTIYFPDLLDALESEAAGIEKGFVKKAIDLKSLKTGMILAEDIYDVNGYLLYNEGYEVTEVLRIRLQNYSKTRQIKEPIKILSRGWTHF